MADINIQRKKASPSPWLLVLLAAVVLGLAAYFFLRPDPADEPAPSAATSESAAPVAVPDTLAAAAALDQATRRAAADGISSGEAAASSAPPGAATAPPETSPMGLEALAAASPATPDYARNGLRALRGVLVNIADRDDLRTPTIAELRDNLTSATDRLDEAGGSLRPGFVAAAALMRAMQQQSYPNLDQPANELVELAGQLSGRSDTPARQQQNKDFLTRAAAFVNTLNQAPTAQP
jgi:hypothetical protein